MHDQKISEMGLKSFFQKNNQYQVALFGAGKCCNDIINILYQNDMENRINKIYDNNIAKSGEVLRGYSIVYPTYMKLAKEKLILIASYVYGEEIYSFLVEQGVKPSVIYKAVDL